MDLFRIMYLFSLFLFHKVVEVTDASDLTMGKVICGNPSKALLSRRRLNPDAAGELDNGAPEITFEPKVGLMLNCYRFITKIYIIQHSLAAVFNL
jgi:hypothetical protein